MKIPNLNLLILLQFWLNSIECIQALEFILNTYILNTYMCLKSKVCLFFSFFIFLIKFSWRRNLHNLCRPKIFTSVFHLIVITCFVGLIWKWYCLVTFIYFICFTCRPKYQVFFFSFSFSNFVLCLFVCFVLMNN